MATVGMLIAPGAAAHVRAAQARSSLFLFVPGVTLSWRASAHQATQFRAITARLAQSLGPVDTVQYSYDGGVQAYGALDTLDRSIARDASVLDGYVRAQANKNIYLIGYSLGGVIAAYDAATHPVSNARTNVRLAGVITLDSPVRGFRPTLPCLRPWQRRAAIPALRALNRWVVLPDLRPSSRVIAAIARLPREVPTLTIASRDDCLVTPAEALLAGAHEVVTHSGHRTDVVASHGAILNDPAAAGAIARFVAAFSVTPTVLPTTPTVPAATPTALPATSTALPTMPAALPATPTVPPIMPTVPPNS